MDSRRKYLSIFLLALFLFPQIVKGIHVFEHHHEAECLSTKGVQINKPGHSCAICEFSFSVPDQPSSCKCIIFVSVNSADYVAYIEAVPFIDIDGQFSPRAPPIV